MNIRYDSTKTGMNQIAENDTNYQLPSQMNIRYDSTKTGMNQRGENDTNYQLPSQMNIRYDSTKTGMNQRGENDTNYQLPSQMNIQYDSTKTGMNQISNNNDTNYQLPSQMNIQYDTNKTGFTNTHYIHNNIELENRTLNIECNPNKNLNIYKKVVDSHQNEYKNNIPKHEIHMNSGTKKLTKNNLNRNIQLKPTLINNGSFDGKSTIPSLNRMMDVNDTFESEKHRMNKKINDIRQSRNDNKKPNFK